MWLSLELRRSIGGGGGGEGAVINTVSTCGIEINLETLPTTHSHSTAEQSFN